MLDVYRDILIETLVCPGDGEGEEENIALLAWVGHSFVNLCITVVPEQAPPHRKGRVTPVSGLAVLPSLRVSKSQKSGPGCRMRNPVRRDDARAAAGLILVRWLARPTNPVIQVIISLSLRRSDVRVILLYRMQYDAYGPEESPPCPRQRPQALLHFVTITDGDSFARRFRPAFLRRQLRRGNQRARTSHPFVADLTLER